MQRPNRELFKVWYGRPQGRERSIEKEPIRQNFKRNPSRRRHTVKLGQCEKDFRERSEVEDS
jgi:hypothetical protein